jgi:aminomethyltransferase
MFVKNRKLFGGDVLRRTALFDFHVENGGKMVPFAGWEMPLQYGKAGTVTPHKLTRTKATIFDVSHMGQVEFRGKDRFDFIESLVPGNIKDLKINQGRLTQLTNETGGILDDTIITVKSDHIYEIVNAGCANDDIAHFKKHINEWQKKGKDVTMKILDTHQLLALQGPLAPQVLQKLVTEDLSTLAFMSGKEMKVAGVLCGVTRCGYTGEDGFELQIPNAEATKLAKKLLENPDCSLAGLGARDTLRLEAGLCLMGHDMNPTITPIEADLSWTIGKRRKEEGGFPGAKVILDQLKNGATKKRVGFVIEGKVAAREGSKIFDVQGKEIGVVTSGAPTPSCEKPIAMGYVSMPSSVIGTRVFMDVRGKQVEATVSKMPFVKSGFYRGGNK